MLIKKFFLCLFIVVCFGAYAQEHHEVLHVLEDVLDGHELVLVLDNHSVWSMWVEEGLWVKEGDTVCLDPIEEYPDLAIFKFCNHYLWAQRMGVVDEESAKPSLIKLMSIRYENEGAWDGEQLHAFLTFPGQECYMLIEWDDAAWDCNEPFYVVYDQHGISLVYQVGSKKSSWADPVNHMEGSFERFQKEGTLYLENFPQPHVISHVDRSVVSNWKEGELVEVLFFGAISSEHLEYCNEEDIEEFIDVLSLFVTREEAEIILEKEDLCNYFIILNNHDRSELAYAICF